MEPDIADKSNLDDNVVFVALILHAQIFWLHISWELSGAAGCEWKERSYLDVCVSTAFC